MPAETRRRQIIALTNRSNGGIISVAELARQLSVSEMTIRRDLDWLHERAVLTRIHGGARVNPEAGEPVDEKPFADRLSDYNPQKEAIGRAAALLVRDGDRILLDAGTTTRQVARNLSSRTGLTVITNNIPASLELSRCPNIETILLGGTLKHQEQCTVGPLVKQGLSAFSVDRLFLSASGFTPRNGLTDPDMRETEVKQAMMQAATQVILVADSSKFGLVRLVKVCPLNAVDILVTDDAISPQALAELEAEGLRVVTPGRIAQSAPQTG
jgi:DeoR family transcriptional regulator, fructose operon transcriptional repressor